MSHLATQSANDMLGSFTASPAGWTMATFHAPRKPTSRWIFCTVAIMAALGFTWLALSGGRGTTQSALEGTAGAASISAPLASAHMLIPRWELGLLPPLLEPAGDQGRIAGTRPDNTTALALGSAGALTLAGLVLLLAWKIRYSSSPVVKMQRSQLSKLVGRAPSA